MAWFFTKKQKLSLAIAAVESETPTKKKRKVWTKSWLQNRKTFSHVSLIKELQGDDFRNYLRMDENCFKELLSLVAPFITKQNTLMREAVSSDERLLATLRFLATGREYSDLKFSTAISPQLLSSIIPETCEAILTVLKDYRQFPATEEDWSNIAKEFSDKWQFTNCVGSMDGKHVLIQKPPHSGSAYFNYKKTFSTVLFAVVNANYEFIYVHTGINGSVSDGGVLRRTGFYNKYASGNLQLPAPCALPGTNKLAPFVFLGDSAFAIDENILKPYPQKNLSNERRIFNYRLSRARRVVENAFGILSARFRIFSKPILINIDKLDVVILATCALHNFLRKKSTNYITSSSLDYEDVDNKMFHEGDWREHNRFLCLERRNPHTIRKTGEKVREIFTDYFMKEGRVSFQEEMINLIH